MQGQDNVHGTGRERGADGGGRLAPPQELQVKVWIRRSSVFGPKGLLRPLAPSCCSRCPSVDPGHRDPLAAGGHQVHGLLQEDDGLLDLIVDERHVEVMAVRLLQDLRLLLQPLQRLVLQEKRQTAALDTRAGLVIQSETRSETPCPLASVL